MSKGMDLPSCEDCGIAWCPDCTGVGPCRHHRAYCPECDPDGSRCSECLADRADDDQGPDYTWGATAAAGLRRLYDPDHGRMTHTGRAGDES